MVFRYSVGDNCKDDCPTALRVFMMHRIPSGSFGQLYRVFLTPPQASTESSARYNRTVCHDEVIHTTVPYFMMRHSNTSRFDPKCYDPFLFSFTIEFDCCTFLYSIKCNILLLRELILMLHCIFQMEHYPRFRYRYCMYYLIYLALRGHRLGYTLG